MLPARWAEMAASNEESVINYDANEPVRYKMRKVDRKGEVVRELVETKDGAIQRLLERDGQALTAEEDQAERKRLQDLLSDPADFFRRVRRDEGAHTYAVELLRSMPKAMLWSYAPGQPQLAGVLRRAVVLDFAPDPHFKPPSLVTEALTGVAGRVWIDTETDHVLRIDGHILHPINFGWGGVLARIQEGGTVTLDQREVGRRWLYSHLSEHLAIREVLVHTVKEDAEVTASDIEALPAPLTYKEGITFLLSMRVQTR